MLQPLDLAVEFIDATTADLVGIILSLTRPLDGPAPIMLADLNSADPEGPLFRVVPWGSGNTEGDGDPCLSGGYELLPLTARQCRALRELVALHSWAMAETGALR